MEHTEHMFEDLKGNYLYMDPNLTYKVVETVVDFDTLKLTAVFTHRCEIWTPIKAPDTIEGIDNL